jgi:hypothetical protein
VLDSRALQEWKVAHDTDRVARVTRSATALADGVGTPHDARVLRGERDVLGVVRGRPYAEQALVAKVALDDGTFGWWERNNDPAFRAKLEQAIEAVAGGTHSADEATLLERNQPIVLRLLGDRPTAEQNAVAATMLGLNSSSFEGVQAAMRDMALDARTRMDALPDIEELRPLRAEMSELLDRNIRRMSGFEARDPNRGYARHADYAELGRVQQSLELFEAVAKGRASSSSASEVLSW